MSDTLLALLTSLAAFAFAAGSPGPATLAVAGTSMARGRGQGLAMALGLSVGLAFWGALVGMGFAVLLTEVAIALTLLKLIGAGYLFYLAYLSARSARMGRQVQARASDARGPRAIFLRGLWLNLLNPKAALAWIAALALGTGDVLTITICALLGLGIYVFYATLFSLSAVMAFYARSARWIDAGFAVFFAWAGGALLIWRTPG